MYIKNEWVKKIWNMNLMEFIFRSYLGKRKIKDYYVNLNNLG